MSRQQCPHCLHENPLGGISCRIACSGERGHSLFEGGETFLDRVFGSGSVALFFGSHVTTRQKRNSQLLADVSLSFRHFRLLKDVWLPWYHIRLVKS